MRHVFERNRARGTGLFTRRVIAAVATVAMLAGVGCVTASSAAAEDATGALEQQIEQPVLQESGQEDSQPVEQNLMVGEEQPSEQEQPSDQEAYQQVEQETKEETEQWVEQEVEQQSEQQSDEQPVTLSAQPIARANRAQSVAQNETGSQLGAPEKHKRIKKNNDGTYTLNVDVKGAVNSTTVTTTQPIDFTLVLDVSGSMDDPMSKTDRTKRLDALKEAVKAFLDEAANTNTEAGSELVRVGLVKFAGDKTDKIGDDMYRSGGYTYNYSQIVSNLTADMNGLKNKVSKLKAAGATRADNGFNRAVKVMGSASARTDAKKVVIFFADGSPTSSSGFEGKVANKAVEAAKELKDGGATVYSIGIFAKCQPVLALQQREPVHACGVQQFPKGNEIQPAR